MTELTGSFVSLQGKVILVAEDNYLLAHEIALSLQERGAVVIGPVASVRDGLALAEREGDRIDAAVLDVNLRNERVFAVADALISRGIPIVFCTGYEPLLLGKPYVNAPCITKPIDPGRLAKTLSAAIAAAPPAEHREPR